MNIYKKLFAKLKKQKEKALVAFVVVGDPDYNTSLKLIKTIVDSGADALELGFAFSDPIADGATIQNADVRALKHKINTDRAFGLIKKIREYNSEIPIGLLVYYNLVFQRSINKFFSDAKKAGVDSVLIADMPIEESDAIISTARKNKIETPFIISPLTGKDRIKTILKKTKAYVYVVSRLGVTGVRANIEKSTLDLIKKIKPYTKLPLCVGFGISKPEHVKTIAKAGGDGAIVGSAIVKIIEKNLNNKRIMIKKIGNYIKLLKIATK